MSENTQRARRRTLLTAATAAVVALAVAALAPRYVFRFPFPPHSDSAFDALLQVKLFFSTFTVVLLLVLLATYIRIYRDLPNNFTLSLLLFTVALTLYAITSNPLLPILFGFDHPPAVGPFTFLPDAFTSVAVVILLYQSLR